MSCSVAIYAWNRSMMTFVISFGNLVENITINESDDYKLSGKQFALP